MTLPQGAPTEAPSAEDANMAEPLHPDLEEALWNSFQEGILATSAGQSPGGSTIPSTADLDDRRMKWPRNDGKGDGKPGSNPGNQGDGARQDSRQDWRARGRGDGYRRKAEDSWGSRWHEETPSSRELERLKTMVLNMQRLLLRHEDAINIWRAACSFVLFVRSGIPASVIPGMVAAKAAWNRLKSESPEKLSNPMRCALFSCLIKEMLARVGSLDQATTRKQTKQKLGWMDGEDFLTTKWDPKQKKLVGDPSGARLTQARALEVIATLGEKCQSGTALVRFHPTRPIGENMAEGTVCFLLQLNLLEPDGRTLYDNVAELCSTGATQLLGLEIRKERLSRSTLAQQLSKA